MTIVIIMVTNALASSAVLTLKGDGEKKINFESEVGSVTFASDPDASKPTSSGVIEATHVHVYTGLNTTFADMANTITTQATEIATLKANAAATDADIAQF